MSTPTCACITRGDCRRVYIGPWILSIINMGFIGHPFTLSVESCSARRAPPGELAEGPSRGLDCAAIRDPRFLDTCWARLQNDLDGMGTYRIATMDSVDGFIFCLTSDMFLEAGVRN